MRHVDEGTIHALLDRELPAEEAEAVVHHLAGCGECTRRMEEARLFFTEADRLLAELEPPAPEGVEATDRPPASLFDALEEGSTLPDPEAGAVGGATPEPIILIPPTPETPLPQWEPRRRSRGGLGLIAAGLVAVAGASYFLLFAGRNAAKLPAAPMVPSVAFDIPASAAEVGRSAAESAPPSGAQPLPEPAAPAPPTQTGALDSEDERRLAAASPARGEQGNAAAQDSGPANAEAGARADAAADEALPPKAALTRGAAAKAQPPRRPPASSAAPRTYASRDAERTRRVEEAHRATNVVAGRQATEEVSRRARARAAETTASAASAADTAPQIADADSPAASVAPAAPAPEVDERAAADRRYGVYTRVGLDEAKRLLGGPVHAIPGYRPLLTGLVDASVVRVVYVDGAGRTIYLDQQRGSGPGEPQISTGARNRATWSTDGVLLTLTATMPADEFRALVRQVR